MAETLADPVERMPPACCVAGCMGDATVWEGDDGYCFDCIDLMVERWEALSIAPGLRELLPGVGDR